MLRHTWRSHAVALAISAGALVAMLPADAATAPGLAPMFTLEGLQGQPVSLAAYKGSPIILLFWAPW